MPLPLTVSCFSKFQIGFTFLVPAHPGSPGQRAIKQVCMCVFQTATPVMEANKINNNKTHTVLCNNQVITSVVRVGVCDYSWQTPRTFLFRQQSGRIKSTHSPHTHTRLTALFLGLPRWAGTRKEKPIWILLKQETVSGSGIRWAICKFAPPVR